MMLILIFFLSIMFLFMNHPLTMGLMLLVQTILISMITGLLNSNFWFSYILFLIMIGGMLVIFIYMTSIASNEMFSYSNSMMMLSFTLMLIMTIMYVTMDLYFYNSNFIFMETIENKTLNNSLVLTKYFNYPSMLMIFFMIIYLFITLIAIVKITKIEYGPLRQMS